MRIPSYDGMDRSDTTGHMYSSAIYGWKGRKSDPIIVHDKDRISPVQAQMMTETDYRCMNFGIVLAGHCSYRRPRRRDKPE